MPSHRRLPVTPRALLEIKSPTDLAISRDGLKIAYTVEEVNWDDNKTDQHLFVTYTNGDGDPRQLTRGDASESLPLWSPDGLWIAFLRTQAESDDSPDEEAAEAARTQVWVLPMDGLGGEAERLTDAPSGVSTYEWLPDSTGIVYLAREPRPEALQTSYEDRLDLQDDAVRERSEIFRQQIWGIDLKDRSAKLIYVGDAGLGEITVSPDGLQIAFSTNYTGEENDYHLSDIWTVSVEGGETTRLTSGPGGKYHPRWHPSGERIFFIRALDPQISFSQPNIYSVTSFDDDLRCESEALPFDVAGWRAFGWSESGALFVSAADGVATIIMRREGNGDFQERFAYNAHVHEFLVAADGSLVFVMSDAENCPELYWLPNKANKPEALTDLNTDWHDAYALQPVMPVTWNAPDGLEIEGLLTYPAGYKLGDRCPMVVTAHGGPYARSVLATTSGSLHQVLAADGFAVLSPNYRGSEGYGNEFGLAIRGDLGGGDYFDVIAGVDWAIEQGIADPERLGIIGSSYGGYLANLAIARSNRFKAAVSAFGIFSLVSDFLNSETPRWETEYLAGTYWDKPEDFLQRSPVTAAPNIETPVLIMHGESDGNTFYSNSQELYTALRLLSKPVEMVRYPREGHGFAEPLHRLDEMRRVRAWFDRYLRCGGESRKFSIGEKVRTDDWEMTVASVDILPVIGREIKGHRFVEVDFVLQDVSETRRSLSAIPRDISMVRVRSGTAEGTSGYRPLRPVGIPVHVLGQTVLAEAGAWRFEVSPGKDDRGLTAPFAVAFSVPDAGGRYQFRFRDFTPIEFDVPPEPPSDDKNRKETSA